MLQQFFREPETWGWVTHSQLQENFDVTFKDSGWYELPCGDYLLVIERHGKLKYWLWVGLDPRDEFEKLLDLPKFG